KAGRDALKSEAWTAFAHGFFFFQAEDGIRGRTVTGVQTCALPICADRRTAGQLRRGRIDDRHVQDPRRAPDDLFEVRLRIEIQEIGRASCREECRSGLWLDR